MFIEQLVDDFSNYLTICFSTEVKIYLLKMLVNECDKDLLYILQVAFSIKANEFACRKKKFVSLAKMSSIPDNPISQGKHMNFRVEISR